MFKYAVCFFLFILSSDGLFAQFTHDGRGMYVNRFFRTSVNASGNVIIDPNYSLLSFPAKEDQLLSYARDNHITYLVLYDLHRIFGNPVYESYLCSFMEKAKTLYCIEKIGVASSCAAMFENVASISPSAPMSLNENANPMLKSRFGFLKESMSPEHAQFYRSEVSKLSLRAATFNDMCQYKFDVLVTEYEFWNSGADNCTGEPQTKDQKYQNFQLMVTDMDLIRDNYNSTHTGHKLYVEAYLGFLNQNTNFSHQNIANWIDGMNNGKRRADRLSLHYYGNDPAKLYSRTSAGWNNSGYYLTRFLDFCESTTNNQSIVQPIFSSEYIPWGAGSNFLGAWFFQNVNNNIFTAEKIWYNDWYDDAKNYHQSTVGDSLLGNVVKPGQALWFTSAQMSGRINNPILFTSNSPVCVAGGQSGSFSFQYSGPIEKGISYKFYLTDAGGQVLQCGTTNPLPWPSYDPVSQTSIDLNAALGSCSLPPGDYDAHLELTFDTSCATCVTPCNVLSVPPVRVRIVNTGSIVALTPTTECQGSPVYLQASSSAGNTSYVWYNGATPVSGATSSTFAPVATGTNNYSCKITSSVPGCSANLSNVIPVTINPYPTATITLQSSAPCTATLLAGPSGNSYSWQNGSSSSTFTALHTGTYSVAVSKNGCTSYVNYTYRKVTASFVSQTNPCDGLNNGTLTYNLYWGASPYSLSWSGPVSGNMSGLTSGNRTIGNLPAGSYAITITDASGCTYTTNATLITDIVASASNSGSVCETDSVALFSGSAATYSWTGPLGFSSTVQNPVIANATPQQSGNYVVIVTGNSGCTATASTQVVIHPKPVPSVSSNSPVCENDTIKLFAGGGATYSWAGAAGFTSQLPDPVIPHSTYSNGGLYEVLMLSAEGCSDTSSTYVIVKTRSLYYADADGDGYGVSGDTMSLCDVSGIYTATVGGDCNDDPATGYYINPATNEICGNGVDENCNGVADDSCTIAFSLKIFIEGFYRGNNLMAAVAHPDLYPTLCDTVTLSLHGTTAPFPVIYTTRATIDIHGHGVFMFPASAMNNSYFVVVKHRNSIETWSGSALLILPVTNYDFTSSDSQAFGNNMADLQDGNFAIISGDITNNQSTGQDGIVDFYDLIQLQTALQNFVTGYVVFDLDGNGIVESADFSILGNNFSNSIIISRP